MIAVLPTAYVSVFLIVIDAVCKLIQTQYKSISSLGSYDPKIFDEFQMPFYKVVYIELACFQTKFCTFQRKHV